MLMLISPVLASVYRFLKAVLLPFIVAMIISYILNPVVNVLHKRKMPRTVAVLLIYTMFIMVISVVLLNVIPMFMKQVKDLREHYPKFTIQAQRWTEDLKDNRLVPQSIRDGFQSSMHKAEQMMSGIVSRFLNGIGDTLNAVFVVFIIPFLTFYMLKDMEIIEKAAFAVVPRKHRGRVVELLVDIDKALGNYIRGQLFVCLITGALAYLGYWLIGLPYPLLLASLVALFNIIPFLGPFIGAAPAILMAATVSWQMVMFTIGINLSVQLLENNVISPQVVGRTLRLHPLLIIFALLVGGELGGILGMILAVPVFAVLKVIAKYIYVHMFAEKDAV